MTPITQMRVRWARAFVWIEPKARAWSDDEAGKMSLPDSCPTHFSSLVIGPAALAPPSELGSL
jgi:hypothetical protein